MATFTKGDDGRYHCAQCDATYGLPQHLGLHMRHKHGASGTSKSATARRKRNEWEEQRERSMLPAKQSSMPSSMPLRVHPRARAANGHAPLTADVLCRTVLAELVPSGYVHLDGINPYVDWLKATESFLEALNALP